MSSSVTLYDDAGNPVVVSGEALKKGLATAWVKFDGIDGAVIKDSFNVSSVVRVSVGVYEIHFETPMDNANYVFAGSSQPATASGTSIVQSIDDPSTVNICNIRADTYSNGAQDNDNISVIVHGGKS